MASTILYKFRSGTNFEALPLPGSAARLFDVKRAIVKAKKLDATGSLEFDLSVRNADTDEEYADEGMLLPRGTRLVVQRLPAARGHGFLARMARVEAGMGGGGAPVGLQTTGNIAPSSFYTIESHGDDQDEFVSTSKLSNNNNSTTSTMVHDEEKELAALKAVTETANAAVSGSTSSIRPGGGGFYRPPPPPTGGPPPPNGNAGPNQSRSGGGGSSNFHQNRSFHHHQRPNADPELREQEQKAMPKKRATGIPRTFLNLKAPPVTDGTRGTGDGMEAAAPDAPLLQPNVLGFEELKSRGGGQSENTLGTRRDLDYALKLTGTAIPEELQCGICHGVVKNAMLLAWDPEGRTACENCIRDALAQNGFRCPLTGMEGVSPDDLHPNYALRKAAERFIKNVMEKMEEIDLQQVDDDDVAHDYDAKESAAATLLEGDRGDTGVIVSRKLPSRRRKNDDDPFGGDHEDDFGGDVFAVEAEKDNKMEEEEAEEQPPQQKIEEKLQVDPQLDVAIDSQPDVNAPMEGHGGTSTDPDFKTVNLDPNKNTESSNHSKINSGKTSPANIDDDNQTADTHHVVAASSSAAPHSDPETPERHQHHHHPYDTGRREVRRRGPPVGYAMGPAGGAAVHPATTNPVAGRPSGDGSAHHQSDRGGRFDGYQGGADDDGTGQGNGSDQPHSYFGGRGRTSPYHYGGGRSRGFFSDRPPFRAGRGRRGGGGRFPGRYFGGRYNDSWQQPGGGRGQSWEGGYPSVQQQAPSERFTQEDRSIDDSAHHSHDGGTGGGDEESRGTKRTRPHDEEATSVDVQPSSQDQDDQQDYSDSRRQRQSEHHSSNRHHHRSDDYDSGSHGREGISEQQDSTPTSRHHHHYHDNVADSDHNDHQSSNNSGKHHHHSSESDPQGSSHAQYGGNNHWFQEQQAYQYPYQQDGGQHYFPGSGQPGGRWGAPRGDMGGRFNMNWNGRGGGGRSPSFRGGFRGGGPRGRGGFRSGGRGGFPRARY